MEPRVCFDLLVWIGKRVLVVDDALQAVVTTFLRLLTVANAEPSAAITSSGIISRFY